MYIKNIQWINEQIKEAEVTVSDGVYSIVCFSCPCKYSVGEVINDNIDVLDINNIKLSKTNEYKVTKINESFLYKIDGMLSDDRCTVIIGKLTVNIESEKIPNDIIGGSFIEADIDRFDIY